MITPQFLDLVTKKRNLLFFIIIIITIIIIVIIIILFLWTGCWRDTDEDLHFIFRFERSLNIVLSFQFLDFSTLFCLSNFYQ